LQALFVRGDQVASDFADGLNDGADAKDVNCVTPARVRLIQPSKNLIWVRFLLTMSR
jgi:hypothetical protein